MDIRAYNSYRKYLVEKLNSFRKRNAKFSYSYFSSKMGASESYLKQVISARRTLSVDKARKLGLALRLSEDEVGYLLNLVLLEQAKDGETKDFLKKNLRALKRLEDFRYSRWDERSVFHNSLTWEIYTLMGCREAQFEPHWIKEKLKQFRPTLVDVRAAMAHLSSHGLINDGKLKGNIVLKDRAEIRQAYKSTALRGVQYLSSNSSDAADRFESFCITLSAKQKKEIAKILDRCKKEVAAAVQESHENSDVSYLNIQFFSVT